MSFNQPNGYGGGRKSYARLQPVISLPKLIQVQLDSFRWFQEQGLRALLDEITPIVSYNKNLELYFGDYRFGEPKYPEKECRERDSTFFAPLYVQVKLVNRETGEIQEQEVFMGDFPQMTENGTFIYNGAERVIVSQLIRSPGVYFKAEEDRQTGRILCSAKIIPNRGAWLEMETSKRDIISVKVDRKRKLPVTILLRAIGYATDEEILALFAEDDNAPEHQFILSTLEKEDPDKRTPEEALLDFYRRLRPVDPPTLENAKSHLEGLLFNPRRYDLGQVGRYKINKRLELDIPLDHRTLTNEDIVQVVRRIIRINSGVEEDDDIDHLGNRRVKTVGELIQNQLRVGLLRMERVVRERMSIRDPEQVSPLSLINIRPVVAAVREFFGGSQLSQFMDQTNPLAELTNKRRLSSLGPGGLRRERAGFEVRDVHHSHYGRICPIETPEGPNIGLIGSLATYARINSYGFIETPYRKVLHEVKNTPETSVGRTLDSDVVHPETGETLAKAGDVIDEELAARLTESSGVLSMLSVEPFVSDEVVFLSADDEERYAIAQASTPLSADGRFLRNRVSVRRHQTFEMEDPRNVFYMDISPQQIVSVSTALIPFLEHDDANRALMGSNMQRQAVPLIVPQAPIVGTGMEGPAAMDSGHVLVAKNSGRVLSVSSTAIIIEEEDGFQRSYEMRKYDRSNQSTCINHRPVINKGQFVEAGDMLADSSSTDGGELALGRNVLVAFLSWEGGNYEDAILISERLVRDDVFSSIHIEKYEAEARDTKLGPEEITRDIPNVGEEALKNLDERGVIRIGAEVKPGDILVGKITPKGETELTPEEKLLRAIFGEKAREVRDSSLRLPHGERGKVVDIREFTRDNHRDLPAGVEAMVRVSVAQRRKLTAGDKMAGRHGNKGVVSRIVAEADMPFLEDGTPVDIILNPLGVPARMNIGQILETHLGWAADRLGFQVKTPVFDGASERDIEAELARAWLIDKAWDEITADAWTWIAENGGAEAFPDLEDDNEARLFYLEELLADADIDGERMYFDRVYARRQVLAHWLEARGYDAELLMIYEDDTRPLEEWEVSNDAVVTACLREWMKSFDTDPGELSGDDLAQAAATLSKAVGWPAPVTGKMKLFDGKTGEPYEQPVTVGIINMLKLHHLVEDKVHARSTGPYSLVTQQPLGGKAQFGGQRFGEMEVWALEAYGVAHTLQEVLTVKSDDVTGRVRTYEAIVKGEPIQSPGVPESFRVLVKELQSLGLSVEVYNENEESIQFTKEDTSDQLPNLGFSLTSAGPAAGRE
ncbi:MAG TPA: DNA-directed RNA polymerase subunit beta [Caldilineae bacterium]|nr:DNA-directed RNA polymerase subunit beta [Caldilineae bacterium]